MSPKQRMLAAYRGFPSDRPPVAPEFWHCHPARVLGVDMVEFQREIHRQGRLLHVHFHGRSREALADFPRIGADCACPFERPPRGDLEGREGLRTARRLLADKVTFNGNVHTVETLIRGTPEDVRREVREIKEEFAGSRRLVIGTGDQVGRETPEENVLAMVEEAKT